MESTHGAGCRSTSRCHGVISFIRNSWSVFPKLRWLCHLTQPRVPWVVGVSGQVGPLSLPVPGSLLLVLTVWIQLTPNPASQTVTCIPNFMLSPGEEQSLPSKSQQLRALQSSRTCSCPREKNRNPSTTDTRNSLNGTQVAALHAQKRECDISCSSCPRRAWPCGLRVWRGNRW